STRAALIKDHRIMALGKPSEVLTEQTMGELYNIKTHIIECSLDEGEQLKQVLPVRTLNN
ncbi:MAG: ABC transporter ATP-binding protein, partial [Syntrophomonadaceae bacterium]|nr:ABC transporter ATP-binding protein [Syntrophomonadaceae bacterium]